MSAKSSLALQSALMATGLVQPVSEKMRGGYLEVLCRQVPGQEKTWLKVVSDLLEYSSGSTNFEFHICRRYVLRNGQMVFGWHISLDCKSAKVLAKSVEQVVIDVLERARPTLESREPTLESREERPAPQPVPQAPQGAYRAPLAPGQHPVARIPPPRPPNAPGAVIGTKPSGFVPQIRVVQNSRDQNGKVTIVEEMQLPHVYAEMNVPNSKGKGAKLTGGG
jgi:hypothetical protein